ncbi:MAG: hypothetical protein ACI8SR_001428 [Oceanicoccus sp.]|jgi:hypothetical protein
MSRSPGTANTMPVTGAACGIKPSKEAMEVDFSIDFSQAKQFLNPARDEPSGNVSQDTPDNPPKS